MGLDVTNSLRVCRPKPREIFVLRWNGMDSSKKVQPTSELMKLRTLKYVDTILKFYV